MRKQKRESFLVMSMILFNDNNNIHSKEKKKRTMIQKRIKYIHEKKNLRRIALSANVASRNIALPLPTHENNIDFILHVTTFDAFCKEGNKTDQRK